MQTIRLVNFSAHLTDEDTAKIAQAINAQVEEDLKTAWGLGNYAIITGTQTTSDWAVSLVDSVDNGALGWHSDNKSPYGQVDVAEILGYGGGVLTGSYPDHPSVSSVCSHEVVELILDPLADAWVSMAGVGTPAGTSVAKEGCDPCQSFSYSKGTGTEAVDVSDFVLPAWFDSSSAGPWDFLSKCPGPMQLAHGGYMILKAADGSTTQQFGEVLPGFVWRNRVGRKKRRRNVDHVA